MPRILVVDDDPIQVKLAQATLSKAGYTIVTASNGVDGLRKAKTEKPDLIILDINMPGMDGFEVARQIRQSPVTKHVSILMLTASADANYKVLAFSLGVDDYLTKPYNIGELVARVSTLLRRSEVVKKDQMEAVSEGRLVAIHSLRGGLGCSSLAINLSIGLHKLWSKPTILLDNVFTSGQISLLLDTPVHRTWADYIETAGADYSEDALYSSITVHGSGLHFLAAPSDPIEADRVDQYAVQAAIATLRTRFEYMVADLPHDFSNRTLEVLESADRVLLVLSPEIVSVRLAAMALRIYNQLDFHSDKVHLVLAHTSAQSFLKQKEIEQALHKTISYTVPYDPEVANRAVATGLPYLIQHPQLPLSVAIEDLAFFSSKPIHQQVPPPKPTGSWQRVNKRHGLSAGKNRKGRLGLSFFGNLGENTT